MRENCALTITVTLLRMEPKVRSANLKDAIKNYIGSGALLNKEYIVYLGKEELYCWYELGMFSAC